jgi:thiol-disulfide isomerase/thioredoxin
VAVLLLGAAAAAAARVTARWDETRPLLPGDPLPAVTLVDLDGRRIAWEAGRSGDAVTLVELWATWCGACVAAMPAVEGLHQELREESFTLLSVNAEAGSPERVRAFVRQHRLSFPVYLGDDGTLARLRVDSFPTFLLVDRRGIIRSVQLGPPDTDALRRKIRALLAASAAEGKT